MTVPFLCPGHSNWKWMFTWIAWGVTHGEDQRGQHLLSLCWASLHLMAPLQPCCWSGAESSRKRKAPKRGKAGCSLWEGCQGTLLCLSSVAVWDLFSCQCLCLSSHAASPRGRNIHRRWTLFIILILWEGSAVQVLWGSDWGTKNKELACHSAWERNEKKKKKRRREFKCVGEWWWLKFQLAWEIGSHISISTPAFVEVLQLTFMLNEANGNKTGSLACLCPNIWGGTVWKVLLTEDRSFPLPPGMFVLLPQYVVVKAFLSVTF